MKNGGDDFPVMLIDRQTVEKRTFIQCRIARASSLPFIHLFRIPVVQPDLMEYGQDTIRFQRLARELRTERFPSSSRFNGWLRLIRFRQPIEDTIVIRVRVILFIDHR